MPRAELTPLEPQSRFGGKLLEIRVVCPQHGTAVLKGLNEGPGALFSAETTVIRCKHPYLEIEE